MANKKGFKRIIVNGNTIVIKVYLEIDDLILVELSGVGDDAVYKFYLPREIGGKDYDIIMSAPAALLDEFTAAKLVKEITNADNEAMSALGNSSVEDILNE